MRSADQHNEDYASDQIRAERTGHSLADLIFLSRGDIGPGGVFSVSLAVASMAVVLMALAGWIVAAAIGWALLVAALGLLTMPTPVNGSSASLGDNSDTRLLALLTAGIIAQHGGELDLAAWVTLTLLSGVIIGETALKRLHLYTLNTVANLPGQPVYRSDRLPTSWLSGGTVIALALSGVSALFGFTWVPALAIAAAVGAIAVWDLAGRIDRLRFDRRNRKKLTAAIADYQPAFALHWRADIDTDYQIAMWLPYLERLGKPFMVIVRNEHNFAEATALTNAPVLLRRTMADLDDVIVPSLKTVFYVNNAASNSQMVRHPGLKHIMLNHGDSDKAPSYNPVSRMYDKNFVAGQAAIDRFATHGVEVPESQFAIVGRPQVEGVAQATGPISSVVRPRVLYAPTWAGFTADAQYSSLVWASPLIESLITRGCDVVFRPHPYAYRSPALAAACTQIINQLRADPSEAANHIYGDQAERVWSISDCFNNSDALISDVSSVVADYLYSGKPLGMFAVHARHEDFVAEFPLAEAAYVLQVSGDEIVSLEQTLDDLLTTDPLAEARRKLRAYYLGDPGNRPYTSLFFDEVAKYV